MSKKHNNYNKMFGADRDEAKEEVEEVIEGAVIPEVMDEVHDIIESEPEEAEEAVEETVEEPEIPVYHVTVAAKNLNVRKQPSKDGEVAFVAHEGDSFEAIESAGDWTKVLAKGYDVPLYVMSKFLN